MNNFANTPLEGDRFHSTTSAGSAPRETLEDLSPAVAEDEQHSAWAKRFVGNMLPKRAVRAFVTSTTSTIKLPWTLSPWDDNNPVTLPSVRTRDIFYTAVSQVGAEIICQGLEETLDFAGESMKEVISELIQNVIDDKFLDPMEEKKMVEAAALQEHIASKKHTVLRTTAVKTLKLKVHHKLIDIDADILLFLQRPCPILNRGSCAKGWFCPYPYSTRRKPHILRSEDFAIAQLMGPVLNADTKIAHHLWTQSAAMLTLCDSRPSVNLLSYSMIVVLVGISPWRMHAWS